MSENSMYLRLVIIYKFYNIFFETYIDLYDKKILKYGENTVNGINSTKWLNSGCGFC